MKHSSPPPNLMIILSISHWFLLSTLITHLSRTSSLRTTGSYNITPLLRISSKMLPSMLIAVRRISLILWFVLKIHNLQIPDLFLVTDPDARHVLLFFTLILSPDTLAPNIISPPTLTVLART